MNRLTRVAAYAAATTVLCATTAYGASTGNGDIKGPVVESSWGGSWTAREKKYFADPFTKETGIKVEFQSNGSSPTAPALLQAQSGNVSIDIVDAPNALVLKRRNLLADFPPHLMEVIKSTSRKGEYSPYELKIGETTSLIACNSAMVPKCPTNPKEFWDVKDFPGTRAIRNRPVEVMIFALEADGVPRDKIYPIDINRALKKIDEIKPHIKLWPAGVSQEVQVMTDKEAAIIFTANGLAYQVQQKSVPTLKLYWQGGVETASDGYVVLKQAPHKEAAFKYIEWIATHPEQQAAWSEAESYPAPSKKLAKLVPKSLSEALPVTHQNQIIVKNDKWAVEHEQDIQNAWQKVIVSH